MTLQATLDRNATSRRASVRHTGPAKPKHDVVRDLMRTTQFRRDLRRELKTDPNLNEELDEVVSLLVTRQPLPHRLRDHRLWGSNRDFRDLHVRPDLVLVYMPGKTEVTLVRLGSHSELFK